MAALPAKRCSIASGLTKPSRSNDGSREPARMTVRASQLAALADALAAVLPLTEPADAVLRVFFRRHHEMGQHDRAFVAEGVYTVLRRLRSLTAQAGDQTPRHLAIAVTVRDLGISLRELEPILAPEELAWAKGFKARKAELTPAAAAELPDWLRDKLGATLPAKLVPQPVGQFCRRCRGQ